MAMESSKIATSEAEPVLSDSTPSYSGQQAVGGEAGVVQSEDLQVGKTSSSDMASEEHKTADSNVNLDDLLASLGQAETDAFQCGKCKQRKTRYRQAQTRSADEPMTTFVTCVNCGNRWEFS